MLWISPIAWSQFITKKTFKYDKKKTHFNQLKVYAMSKLLQPCKLKHKLICKDIIIYYKSLNVMQGKKHTPLCKTMAKRFLKYWRFGFKIIYKFNNETIQRSKGKKTHKSSNM